MTEIILLEIISMVSFIYSLLLVLFPFATINEIFIIFIWTIILSFIFALNHKKSPKYQSIMLLLLMPLVFYHSLVSIYFIVGSSILIYGYMTRFFMKGSFDEYIDILKRTYIIYTVIGILALIYRGFNNFVNFSIPFIIIYLMTTIILVRILRHIEAGMERGKIRRTNIKYLGAISIISSIVTLDSLRESILFLMQKSYLLSVDILMKIFYYPIIVIAGFIGKIIHFLMELTMRSQVTQEIAQEAAGEDFFSPEAIEVVTFKSFRVIIEVALTILIIYFIIKVIAKVGDRSHNILEYTEEREYIKESKKKKKRVGKEKFPRELKEQIRYYYRRYLEKLYKKKVKILKTDTSIQVNEKAQEVIENEDEIEMIRKIYIDSRYGDKNVDKEVVEEIERLYKKV